MAVGAAIPSFGKKINVLKGSFFDREKVHKAVDRVTRRHLNWFGAYVRKVARNSLKAKDGISKPGMPPHTHRTYKKTHTGKNRVRLAKPQTRSSFKDSILYAYEAEKQKVVIGPFLFNGSRKSPTVPELLEYGGETTNYQGKGKMGPANYRPRPFMRPALQVSIPKFMSRIKDSVG